MLTATPATSSTLTKRNNVGPAPASDSYLDQETIVDVAERAGADAIHPGHGFLAEERRVRSSRRIDGRAHGSVRQRRHGNAGEKTKARSVMQGSRRPGRPGGQPEPVDDAEEVRELGDKFGYPIAIKAEGGGGGRGMKIVRSEAEVEIALGER